MEEKVCKNCKIIISHGTICPICGSDDLTSRWGGYVIVLNIEKSEIAKKLDLKLNGVFALNVKE
ncbi:DNA-directed RNA polymerase, subunit E'' [Candidatus Marsarchaeota archaeon]|jgi:DNA-directed RNA polymerase subunit E"|nr:DNA-directed RNA polymerase, subunit E'' [Candidatus Marsarchaeota archaeon]MCL5092085.1 DNA-directed RNA polymerase, subunit E'' [Candidatus Marsarchaeota archaeon]